ncbi:putative pyridoxamine 5'-phosphate oxidase [Drechslerella stenobrocha 248]|uniref:pyridoxal 5'-phosphate synthase n=1 Tax=Drechslerella stenobrocha 248 TaxID=1043628 RepID=W7HMX1_9PEZI|nr:putative pyridoxamine 5'-phosphate oxidase [Drechslerella stenobrocha 248]
MPMPTGPIFRPRHSPHVRGHYHKYKIIRLREKIMALRNTSREVGLHNEITRRSGKLIFAPTRKDEQYLIGELDRENLNVNPFLQFHEWFEKAANTEGVTMPEATTLSTAHMPSGRVSARMVYLKELDNKGFVIYSNWGTSRKAEDIKSNNHASLTFWWKELERQVRVEGITERLSAEESQEYYDTRIRGSRIGAWASRQSTKLENREELEKRVREFEKEFEGKEQIPVPSHWGGIRIIPTYIEFWQGRDSRLHDRFTFTRESVDDEAWQIDRVSP